VIGAGPSGLAAAKQLLEAGMTRVTVFEKGSRVGGNWVYSPEESHSSVFETTHLISSKRLSQYSDFPMLGNRPGRR
jgi:cation diffusion facilitator CzcD-associated flavoprotein CzcO